MRSCTDESKKFDIEYDIMQDACMSSPVFLSLKTKKTRHQIAEGLVLFRIGKFNQPSPVRPANSIPARATIK